MRQSRRFSPGRGSALALGCALLVACLSPEAGLHVVVEGNLVPGVDFDRLSLVAYLVDDRTPLLSEVLQGEELELPARFNLLSGAGTRAGTEVHLLASAERSGQVVSAARGEATLLSAGGGRLTLTLPEPVFPAVVGGAPREVCDNGRDDDGDGLADCGDPRCDGRSCARGGLTCSRGVCGCMAGPVGVYGGPVAGFEPRSGAQALRVDHGPRRGWLAVFGGLAAAGPSQAVELFLPSTHQHEQYLLGAPRALAGATVLPDGRLLLVGGQGQGELLHPDYELVHLGAAETSSARISFEPPLTALRPRVFIGSGGLVLAGGSLGAPGAAQEGQVVLADLESAHGATAAWRWGAALESGRSGGAHLGDGRLVLAGGPGPSATLDLVGPDGRVEAGPRLPLALSHPAVAQTTAGRVLVVGGARAFLVELQGAVVALRETGSLPLPAVSPSAVTLENGWVYVEDLGAGVAHWFDPAAERFIQAPSPPGQRTGEALAPLDRSVFRVGGTAQDGALGGTGYLLELRCGL